MEMDYSEAIIEAVRRRDILWNSNNRNYKNLRLKQNEWVKIAKELNMSVVILKKRWRNLRDNYMRNLHKRKLSGKASDDEGEVIGKYTLQLQFLKDHMKPRTILNYAEHKVEEENLTTSPSQDETLFDFVSSDAWNEVDELPSTPSNYLSSTPKDSKRRILTHHHTAKIEETSMTTIQEFASRPHPSPSISIQPLTAESNSEDDLFCRSLMQKLATFPVNIRNSTKLEMLRYVNQVEEEQLQKRVESNVDSSC